MKTLSRLLGLGALVLVIVPPVARMFGWLMDEDLMKLSMLAGTVLWFIVAPIWFRDDATG